MTDTINSLNVCTNPNGSISNITLMDGNGKAVSVVMSIPGMTGEKGWFRCIHSDLLSTRFTHATIELDLSAIDGKYHDMFNADRYSYNKDDQFDETFNIVHKKLLEASELNKSMTEFLGMVEATIDYANMSDVLAPMQIIPAEFESFRDLVTFHGIKGLTFMFQHVDRNKEYFAETGMAIFDIKSGKLTVTFDPNEFVTTMDYGKYSFCGELFIENCASSITTVTPKMKHSILGKIMSKIESYQSLGEDRNNQINNLI